MDTATLGIIIVGSVLVAFRLFSIYFSSESAQRRFNPDNEMGASHKTRILVEKDYRIRPRGKSNPGS
ncbi:hypothetical protein AFAE65S_00132 [Alcaligenes phenolicus]